MKVSKNDEIKYFIIIILELKALLKIIKLDQINKIKVVNNFLLKNPIISIGQKIGDVINGSSTCDIFEGYKFKIYQEYSFKNYQKRT